jgi:hypothetical protein
MAKVNLTTENSIVNAVGKMAFTGNVIPESWYKTVVSANGRVNLLAVNLLGEIVYWYRPMEVRDERSGDVTWVKKFADEEYLQKSYAQICEKYNVSTKQAREALIVLEKLGVVKRHFRTIETEMGKCPNVMYIELIPDALYKLTYPEPADENGKTSFPSDKEVFTKKETHPSSEVRTNTKNTTETTTKTTTTAQARDVVEKAEEIFAPLKLSKEDIRAIVREAEYDIDRCIKAKAFFDAYRTPVSHATGLLISFVREDYPKQPRIPPAMNPFNSFSQQIYTPEMIDALEKELLSANDCPTVAAVQG